MHGKYCVQARKRGNLMFKTLKKRKEEWKKGEKEQSCWCDKPPGMKCLLLGCKKCKEKYHK